MTAASLYADTISVTVGVTVDVDRDGRPDYRLVQTATLRASGVPK